jgi:hypothetical protein
MRDDQHLIHIKNVAEHRLHQAFNSLHGVVTKLVSIVAHLALMINDQTVDIVLPALPTNEVAHVYRVTIGLGAPRPVDHVSTV